MHSSFWKIIKIDLKEYQNVTVIKTTKENIIIIAGEINNNNFSDMKTGKGFVRISYDNGRYWTEHLFDCFTITELQVREKLLIASGIKYVGTAGIERRIVQYKYDFKVKTWAPLTLPLGKEGTLIQIINPDTYVFDVTENQFGNTYLVTTDGGKTWIEHVVQMRIKKDSFQQYCTKDNKIWGVATSQSVDKSDANSQTLVSIDMNTWNIKDEILLGKSVKDEKGYPIYSHWIADMKVVGKDILLLGKDQVKNDIGYIWKVNLDSKLIHVEDSFKLDKEQIPDKIFYNHGSPIVTYSDISTGFSTYTLLYKKNDVFWQKEDFPELTYPCMSFDDGLFVGIAQKDLIYLKKF